MAELKKQNAGTLFSLKSQDGGLLPIRSWPAMPEPWKDSETNSKSSLKEFATDTTCRESYCACVCGRGGGGRGCTPMPLPHTISQLSPVVIQERRLLHWSSSSSMAKPTYILAKKSFWFVAWSTLKKIWVLHRRHIHRGNTSTVNDKMFFPQV